MTTRVRSSQDRCCSCLGTAPWARISGQWPLERKEQTLTSLLGLRSFLRVLLVTHGRPPSDILVLKQSGRYHSSSFINTELFSMRQEEAEVAMARAKDESGQVETWRWSLAWPLGCG